MKKYGKYIILTIGGLLVYNILKAGSMANKFAKFTSAEALKLLSLQNSLQKAGLSGDSLNYALSQILYETGRFTKRSQVSAANNNYSGIKWLNKPHQIATQGTLVPPNERVKDPNSPLNYYAKFTDMDAWARDYVRILSFGAKPKLATSIDNFVDRLVTNGYFDIKGKAIYLKGIKIYFAMLNK
jgi:hypothetical protein